MEESPYANREIDEKFSDIKDSLNRIESQTTKTNGRVRWLEKMIWLAMGFCGCVTVLILPLVVAVVESGKI
jgi:hypothetical protein